MDTMMKMREKNRSVLNQREQELLKQEQKFQQFEDLMETGEMEKKDAVVKFIRNGYVERVT